MPADEADGEEDHLAAAGGQEEYLAPAEFAGRQAAGEEDYLEAAAGGEEEYLEPAGPAGRGSGPPAASGAASGYPDAVERPGESERRMDDTLDRLQAVHGVLGIVIFCGDGTVLKSSLEPGDAMKLASGAVQALSRARASVAPGDALDQLVIRTKRYEMILTCSETFSSSSGFGMAVTQDPNLVAEKKVGVKDLVAKMRKLGLEIPPGADRAWLLELLESEMMKRGM